MISVILLARARNRDLKAKKMASSSACSSIHVAQISFSRPITHSMAQIARSGFSRTPASQPPGSFSRFSSPSPDSCPKPESQIYIQQLQLLRSFSFSSPILFLSLPSISLPHPPGASKGGGVGRAARGGGGPPPPSPPPLPPPRPPSRGCPPETMARPLSRRTEGRQRHVGTAGRPPSLLPARVGATAPSLASPQRGWLGLRGGGSRPPGGRRPPTRRGVGGPRRWPRPLAGLVPLAFALSPSVLTSLCWIPVCRCSRGLVP